MKYVMVLATLALSLMATPLSAAEQVAVPIEVIEARIKDALPASVRGKNHVLRLNNTARQFTIPAAAGFAAVKISRLHYDDRSGGFTALLSLPAADGRREESLTGRLEVTASIPVITVPMSVGDVIGERDIGWIEIPARQLSHSIVTSADELVGMAARRGLRPDSPIRTSDVQRPILVKRGSLVTMLVTSDRLSLTAVGQALENGSKGDRIRVNNTSSSTTVEGIVISAREVRVISGARIAGLGN